MPRQSKSRSQPASKLISFNASLDIPSFDKPDDPFDGIQFDVLSIKKSPHILVKRFEPPVKFTNDPLEYWYSKDYLGLGDYMSRSQKKITEEIFSDWPNLKYNYIALVAGQRCGKSEIIAAPMFSWFTHHLLAQSPYDGGPHKVLYGMRPETTLSLTCVACSKEQIARGLFSAYKEILDRAPFWKKYLQWLDDLEIQHTIMKVFDPISESVVEKKLMRGDLFSLNDNEYDFHWHNVKADVSSTNSRSAAGRTSAIVAFDETARLRIAGTSQYDMSQAMSAEAIVTTMRNSLLTVGEQGLFLSISSPQHEDDYSIELIRRAQNFIFGKNSTSFIEFLEPRMTKIESNSLGIHMSSFDMLNLDDLSHVTNATTLQRLMSTKKSLESKLEADPIAYRRDFLALPSQAGERFFQDADRYLTCIHDRSSMFHVEQNLGWHDAASPSGKIVQSFYVSLSLDQVLPAPVKFQSFCHGDGGLSRNSFAIAGAHAEQVFRGGGPTIGENGRVNIDQFRTVVDFTLEWIPGQKILTGTTQKEKFRVSMSNVEQVILWLIDVYGPSTFTFDHWAGTAGFIESLMSNHTHSEEFTLKTDHWLQFRRRIYDSAGLFSMFDDRDESGISRSHEQLKRAMQINNKMDFVKGHDTTDGTHGDLITAICAVDNHVADKNADRIGKSSKYQHLRPASHGMSSYNPLTQPVTIANRRNHSDLRPTSRRRF